MSNGKPATPREMIWIGALFAGVGLYFILVGLSVLPIPGGPRNLHAPLWVVVCAGLPFFLGGLAVMLQGFGKANTAGQLPADAPTWLRTAHSVMVVAIFACFAMIGTWVALAGEFGQFSSGFGVGIGRAMFGLGAIICWAATVGMALSGWRKLRGARTSAPAAQSRSPKPLSSSSRPSSG